ncbi:hypothetical protein [Streptomyces sp. NPDC008121]|uniref:hypothetical protein n=1 Tax=Streptomyces sp. NPDC008121 TaxID=3364809 RepID=UPI0036E3C27C
MTSCASRYRRRGLLAAGATAVLALTLAACGSDNSSAPAADQAAKPTASSHAGHETMPGMDHSAGMDMNQAGANGLSDTKQGYRLTSQDTTLAAGKPVAYRFAITGPDGNPVIAFAPDQTKRMHFYAIRSDLSGFQPLHPAMAPDGTWTADPASLQPGSWRVFASFIPDSGPRKNEDFVLSRTLTVPGDAAATPLPAAAASTEVDGYTVTVKGDHTAGKAAELTVSVAKDGKPVTGLQPYLETYAHLTAFHEGDQAFAHLHPETKVSGNRGGPDLSFHAELPDSGNWRLFLQFQSGGKLHTAALTLHVA